VLRLLELLSIDDRVLPYPCGRRYIACGGATGLLGPLGDRTGVSFSGDPSHPLLLKSYLEKTLVLNVDFDVNRFASH
jgi:hypothetical protein